MIEFVRRASGKPFPTEAERLPAIVETVAACVKVRPDRHAALGRVMGDFFHAKAAESFSSMDAAYKVAPSCTGCGICAKVCPRENIAFDGKLPNWRRDCEFCGACSTWCPAGAIGFTGMPASPKRHNPSVAARDFYLN